MTKQYWDSFYEEPHPDLVEPSAFARLCTSILSHADSVFEVGCGNGRDALYMARSGLRVYASDASSVALDKVRALEQSQRIPQPPRLIARPMENLDDRHAGEIDAVYLRFVLHAVPADVGSAGLRWAFRNVRPGGRLFIEARSVAGTLYGHGVPAGRDAFIQDSHYRRFIRIDELRDELVEIGYQIDELIEASGLAIHGNDDPIVIRAFATRPEVPRK
jgi:SAM-dependent methyltransferase